MGAEVVFLAVISQPEVPGQQPRQGCDHCTVSPVRLRVGDLTAQDRDLVPQH
jgi:hypothetical protein